MIDEIKAKLQTIEQHHGIKIIFSCESGSRAWGLASDDSDWDVRFIYKKPMHEYLTVYDTESDCIDRNNSKVIKASVSDNLDFAGWDIRKALFLMSKGNPDSLLWHMCPIKYRETQESKILYKSIGGLFLNKEAIYHFIHMAQGNYTKYILNNEVVKTKKYLYIIRPLLICMWIETCNTIPPISVIDILQSQLIINRLGKFSYNIWELINRKLSGEEFGLEPRNKTLDNFAEKGINYYKEVASKIQQNKDISARKTFVDSIFRTILYIN